MKKKGILIGILALIIIIFLGILYFNDDTRIYKETVNATYEVLDNTLDKYQNIIGFLNKDKKMSLELNDSKEKFNLDLLLSSRNENIYASLKYHNQDWAYLYTNNTSYLKKNNIYQAFDYEVKECEECSPTSLNTILSNTFSPSNVTSKDLKVILNDLKTTINKSWHQNYITKRKINGNNNTEVLYSYLINKNSFGDLFTKINNNKSLKDNIFKTFPNLLSNYGITKENFNKLKDNDILGTLNIHKINKKVTKIELTIQDGFSLTIDLTKTLTIYYKSNSLSLRSIISPNNSNIVLYSSNNKSLELNIKEQPNSTLLEYNMYNNLNTNKGLIEINKDNVNLKTSKFNLNINYQENNNLTLPENIKSDKMNPKEVEDYWDEFKDVLTENTIFKEVIEYLQDLDVLERG